MKLCQMPWGEDRIVGSDIFGEDSFKVLLEGFFFGESSHEISLPLTNRNKINQTSITHILKLDNLLQLIF